MAERKRCRPFLERGLSSSLLLLSIITSVRVISSVPRNPRSRADIDLSRLDDPENWLACLPQAGTPSLGDLLSS